MKTFDKKRAVEFFRAKLDFTTGPAELDRRLREERSEINVVDVRRADDYRKGHIPHAIHLPRDQWETFAGLERNKLNVLYCSTQQCHASAEACLLFAERGYPVVQLEGGWRAWKEYGFEVEGEEALRKAA